MFCRRLHVSIKLKNVMGYVNESNLLVTCAKQPQNEHPQLRWQPAISNFCTQKLPKTANVFGDISGRKFDHFKMDEREKEEENFQDTEGRIPRRLKPSAGQYAKMMKSHIAKKNLKSALQVLDLMKENRDKPTIYLYNLLLHSFADQGDLKQCFRLYNKAKKHGLQPNAATYTCLFNVCAVCDRTEEALEHLNKLRQSLYEKQFPLNNTHYNAMMKAYSWHNRLTEAFQLADEMRDNNIPIKEITYNSLFHAAIADKEAGLRHALIIWHLMRLKKVNPSLTTYNLLLRTIRDSGLGNLKLDDVLISGWEKSRIVLAEGERPNLLASPPVLSSMLLLTDKGQVAQRGDADPREQVESINLNDVFVNNRLILFGGLEGFLNKMDRSKVNPDIKTITLLLYVIPNTTQAENLLIEIAEKRNIELDIDFFNMVIKRRSLRFDYKSAKEVINLTEKRNLTPTVMTFGVLALGCQECRDAQEFLRGMEAFGYVPNRIIMSTLINVACHKKNFEYLLFVMNYMLENNMKPNTQAFRDVDKFAKEIPNIKKPTGLYRLRKLKRLEKNIEQFEQQYPKWQKIQDNSSEN
ncbi:pentatricopeptide repeat-containing protein 1, mitochondrial [Nylanderia fulva]|uniref:pentatricopeptide repeat-containing protein 1, mitochondrial n=1 Tax=Nylanderia fulva TaxID=613905 RepID=UPI0010FB6158|nr:pentatricopeptide repeat-containing protein 1, mitochondrial [Nylanderia fulva]